METGRGQIARAYRTEQEDRIGASGLVLNAAVLWTTRYPDAAVEQLRALPAGLRGAAGRNATC